MLTVAARIWRYIFGPNVLRIHKSTDGRNRAYNYYQNDIEHLAQQLLSTAHYVELSLYYSSPVVAVVIYNKSCCLWATLLNSTRLCGWAAMAIGGALVVRAFGRCRNPEYVVFLNTLENCIEDPGDRESRALLRRYDFDFSDWPVDYVSESKNSYKRDRPSGVFWKRLSAYTTSRDLMLHGLPKELLAYSVAHTFGIWMMFPGCFGLFNITCAASMRMHRNRLIEERCGIRAKLETADGNHIDTMFFDRRPKLKGKNGSSGFDDPVTLKPFNSKTLVICCEGNGSFYECGCIVTPLECGFSVLGWNHPGFQCSTGTPYPRSDVHALEVVMEYAVKVLGFSPSNIILFGWSIGAFSVINVAPQYPDLKGIVLDATFHDALVFAKRMAPPYCDNLATVLVRSYLNMNNVVNLRSYSGPISFIRREKDEVMNLAGRDKISSNVGNRLIEDFLRTRFPNLFDSRACGVMERDCQQALLLRSWFAVCNNDCRENLLCKWDVNSGECKNFFVQHMHEGRANFPMDIGTGLTSVQKSRCVLFLASKYVHHFNASHCTPLPAALFPPPWKLENLLPYSHGFSEENPESLLPMM